MKNIKCLSIGLLIVAIALPSICIFLIGLPRLPNIGVVGEASNWLSLYGSYIGDVIATLCSFIILTIFFSKNDEALKDAYKYWGIRINEFRQQQNS